MVFIFFDCDFSNIEAFTITDISYNLCVSGYYEEGNKICAFCIKIIKL